MGADEGMGGEWTMAEDELGGWDKRRKGRWVSDRCNNNNHSKTASNVILRVVPMTKSMHTDGAEPIKAADTEPSAFGTTND